VKRSERSGHVVVEHAHRRSRDAFCRDQAGT